MKNNKHLKHAKQIISAWPKWKQDISFIMPNSKFDIDGNVLIYDEDSNHDTRTTTTR